MLLRLHGITKNIEFILLFSLHCIARDIGLVLLLSLHGITETPDPTYPLVSLCIALGETRCFSLHWRHNGHGDVSNHQLHHCLLNCRFGRRTKKTPKLRVTGLCAGNSPGTGEFPAQMASNTENISIWWRHHVFILLLILHWLTRETKLIMYNRPVYMALPYVLCLVYLYAYRRHWVKSVSFALHYK